MNEGELQILIKLMSDTVGAEQANRVMEKFKGETKGSGQELEKHNKHSREMHRLMHELNRILPGTGYLMKAAFDPENIKLIGTLAAVTIIVGLIEKYRKQLEEVAKLQAEMKSAVWESERNRLRETSASAAEYAHKLELIAQNKDAIRQKEEIELAVLEAQNKARENLAGMDALRKAELERQGEAGKIRKLEDIASTRLYERYEAGTTAEVAAAALRRGAPGSVAAAEAEKQLPKLNEQLNKAQEALGTAKSRIMTPDALAGMSQMERGFYYQALPGYREEIEKATASLSDARRAQDLAKAQVNSYKEATKKLTETNAEAQTRLEETITGYRQAQHTVEKERAVFGATQLGEEAAELSGMGLKPGSRIGHSLLRVIQGQEARKFGDQLTADQINVTADVKRALEQQGLNQKQISEAFKMMGDLHIDHTQKMKNLLTMFHQLKQQVARNAGAPQ